MLIKKSNLLLLVYSSWITNNPTPTPTEEILLVTSVSSNADTDLGVVTVTGNVQFALPKAQLPAANVVVFTTAAEAKQAVLARRDQNAQVRADWVAAGSVMPMPQTPALYAAFPA